MSYRDLQLQCAECGKAFFWTVEEQRALEEAGQPVVPPAMCRAHRPVAHEEPFGRVKWFSAEKGYGFLVEPDGSELFFHVTALAPGVEPVFADGQPVTYDIQYGIQGARAVNVAPYHQGKV